MSRGRGTNTARGGAIKGGAAGARARKTVKPVSVGIDPQMIAKVRDETDREILKQLTRAAEGKPTTPELPLTSGRDQKRQMLPDDLLTMAAWAQAAGHSSRSKELLARAEEHLVGHIAWLKVQPRLIGHEDRDRQIVVAELLLERARLHLADDQARATEALELGIRADRFREKARMSAVLAPALKEAVSLGQADLIQTISTAIADAQGDPEVSARVAALPLEQFERYGRIVAADMEQAGDRSSWREELKDQGLIDDLLGATEDKLMERRLDDYSGHERLVLAARLGKGGPESLGRGWSAVKNEDLNHELRGIRRNVEVLVDAGRGIQNETRLGPDDLKRMITTLHDNQAEVSIRVHEEFVLGNTTEAELSYVVEARAEIDGAPVSLRFKTKVAESRQRSKSDRLARAIAEGEALQLPSPEPGLWSGDEELTGTVAPAPRPLAPALTSVSDILGLEKSCDHGKAEWDGNRYSSSRAALRCPDCRRTLAHVPFYRLPNEAMKKFGDRRDLAKHALPHERALARLRGDDPPALSTLLSQSQFDTKGQLGLKQGSAVTSVAAAMNRR